jgi:hypothetical protein
LLRILFIVVALDLFLGGGGRLIEFGPLSLRMVLFAVALVTLVVFLVGRPGGWRSIDGQERFAIAAVAAFFATHAGAVAIGWLSDHPLEDIVVDIKPLLFVLMAPFFALCLKTTADVAMTERLLRIAGPVLAILYLAIWGGLAAGALDFAVIYPLLNDTGEFFFRGESFFFYKGFLFLGVGIVFLLAQRGAASLLLAMLVAVALLLTLTRGFVLSTAIAVLAFLMFRDRRMLVAAMPLVAASVFIVLVYLPGMDHLYLEQRELSNTTRGDDWNHFLANANIGTLLVGQGFGAVFNQRLLFENSYLWLLWKGGLPVLAFWLTPFALATYWLMAAARSPRYHVAAAAWWCALLLVYVQTATNPFLNNPIGLSVVLLSVLSLRVLARAAAVEAQAQAQAAASPPWEARGA